MRLENGQKVGCTDGAFGELADVVIDPTTSRVTHLVVQPHDAEASSRLVPIELVEPDDESSTLSLRCTLAEAGALEHVQEFGYLRVGEFPVADPGWDVGVQDLLASPFYASAGLGGDPYYAAAGAGGTPPGGDERSEYDPHVGARYDRIPKGEVEIRRTSEVFASGGERVGHVDGFLVDADGQITHIVLEHGHLWGRRDVTVPIGNVADVATDSVALDLTKDEVGELPQQRVHRWGAS